MRNRWLVVTAIAVALLVLLAIAAWLSDSGVENEHDDRPNIVYPRDIPDGPARNRVVRERAPPDKQPPKEPVVVPQNLPRLDAQIGTDVQRAVGTPGQGYLVIDVAALTHSELATKILKCHAAKATSRIEKLRKATGLNFAEDVEQVGLSEEVLAMGGRLGAAKIPAEFGPGVAYGTDARIYDVKRHQEDSNKDSNTYFIAKIANGLLLAGDSRNEVMKAIDRVEGRSPSEMPGGGHADVRGRLTRDDLKKLLGDKRNDELAPIAALTKGVGLHMNVEDHVAVSLDLKADDKGGAADLSAAMKSAVMLTRQFARRQGHKRTAWLLDQARFHDPDNEGFALDLAVPGDLILKGLGCDSQGNPAALSPAAASTPVSDNAARNAREGPSSDDNAARE